MWHMLRQRLTRTGINMYLKMNSCLSYFHLKCNQFLNFNIRQYYYRNEYKSFYGSKVFLMDFLHYNYNNGHYWRSC